DRVRDIRYRIEAAIPVGFAGNKEMTFDTESWSGWSEVNRLSHVDKDLIQRARLQLGSLGGGNHFIELCLSEDNQVWVMLHSGSRNVGKTLADRHIQSAKGIMKRMDIKLPDPDLAHLFEGTPEFDNYIRDL